MAGVKGCSGGARPGAGRKASPLIVGMFAEIKAELIALRQQRRNDEALIPVLRRLTEIERRLGMREQPQAPVPRLTQHQRAERLFR
jgi:hypothetical protein